MKNELLEQSYNASLAVLRSVVPFLSGGDEMRNRLQRSVRSIPRLIAAGMSPDVAHNRKTYSISEAGIHCRETVVMLSYCKDLHGRFINGNLCAELIGIYQNVGDELQRYLGGDLRNEEVAK